LNKIEFLFDFDAFGFPAIKSESLVDIEAAKVTAAAKGGATYLGRFKFQRKTVAKIAF